MNDKWFKAGKTPSPEIEEFFRERESFCVSACDRYFNRKSPQNHLWYLKDERHKVTALLLHSRSALFPVFGGIEKMPVPRFMGGFLRTFPIHLVQGLKKDVMLMESVLNLRGYRCLESFDYFLMELKTAPQPVRSGPPGLQFRVPVREDLDQLFDLQAGYEKEEVLPKGAVFSPVSCKLSLEGIFARERMLVAELDGRLVGKVNTNARSFSRYQIGGVYVLPSYRGRGIGLNMAAAFAEMLAAEGWKLTLFVKQQNAAALSIYKHIGFSIQDDYRISYY